ncbi:MAG: hypothetical protein JXA07_13355 [Spirochaetes bacterium]|nr:hypothetical protein [Spirochaetota bacterium]
MPDTLDTASESLSDFARKLEVATFYTNGDEERARQMIAGSLNDIYVIKGRFSSTSHFGAFIVFFNHYYLKLNSIYAIISDDFALKDMKTSRDWITFENDLASFAGNSQHDDVLDRQLRNALNTSFSLSFSGELKKLVEEQSDIEINRLFQQVVMDRMGLQSVNSVVDIEVISSLDMELHSLTSRKIPEIQEFQNKQKELEPDVQVDTEDDDREVLKGREVRLVLRGSLILAPISGRDIGLLVSGDRLKLKVVDTHEKAIQVLKAFNAITSDGVQPILGRIVSIRHRNDGGYTIYAIVAKGIYVKVEELEENIKIAIDTSGLDAEAGPDRISNAAVGAIVGLVVLLAALLAFVIYFVVN